MFVGVQVCVQGCMQKHTSMCLWAGGEALVLLLRHCPLSFPETGSLTDLELIKTDEAGQRCPGMPRKPFSSPSPVLGLEVRAATPGL